MSFYLLTSQIHVSSLNPHNSVTILITVGYMYISVDLIITLPKRRSKSVHSINYIKYTVHEFNNKARALPRAISVILMLMEHHFKHEVNHFYVHLCHQNI